jgi:hypothetical protein
MNNVLIAFLKENLNRLFTKKPRFFIWWQWLTGALSAVTGLPGVLESINVTLPETLAHYENKIVAACAAGFFLASQLTSASPVATVTKDGAILKQTDASALPFTAQVEVKKAQDAQVPNAAVTLEDVKKPA